MSLLKGNVFLPSLWNRPTVSQPRSKCGECSYFSGGGVCTLTGVSPLLCGCWDRARTHTQLPGAGRRDSLGLCVQSPAAQSVACHQPHCLLLRVSPSRAEFPAICPSTSAHTSLGAVPTAWLQACPARRWTVPNGCERNHCHGAAPQAPRAVGTPGRVVEAPIPTHGEWSSHHPQSLGRLHPKPLNRADLRNTAPCPGGRARD